MKVALPKPATGKGAEKTVDPWLRLAAPPERMAIGHHNGPGLRFILWVQGCSLRCTTQCLNPHLLRRDGGHRLRASEFTAALRRMAGDYPQAEGVTVLGGEPFDQAAALAKALKPLQADGLSIMVYTGHVLENLLQLETVKEGGVERQGAQALLEICDLLVDGPFLSELHDDSLVWRGSSNQRILRLSERYQEQDLEKALADQHRAFYLARSAGDQVVAGAQNPATAQALRRSATSLPVWPSESGRSSGHE